MSDLAEFLLARFGEDEAPTWTLSPYACEPGCCAPEGWVGSQCRYCDSAPVYGGTVAAITRIAEEHAEAIHQRSRVLADCKAKRRIVEGIRDATSGPVTEYYIGPMMTTDDVLALFTMPYADHPEFREEWKP